MMASVVSTSRNNWVLGVQAHHSNPYDGHTLESSLEQAEQIAGMRCGDIHCDRGYRGVIKELKDRSITIEGKASKLLSPVVKRGAYYRVKPMEAEVVKEALCDRGDSRTYEAGQWDGQKPSPGQGGRQN